MRRMICAKCGKDFIANLGKKRRQKYCSKKCRWSAQNLRRPIRRIRPAPEALILDSVTESKIEKLDSDYTEVATSRRKRTESNPGAKSPKVKAQVTLWEKDGVFSRTWERGARPVMKVVPAYSGAALVAAYFRLVRRKAEGRRQKAV